MSAGANYEWRGPELEADIRAADRLGLRAAAEVFLTRAVLNISRPGAPTSETAAKNLRSGFRRLGLDLAIKAVKRGGIFNVIKGTVAPSLSRRRVGQSKAAKRAERDAKGLLAMPHLEGNIFVDPPGGMPRKRTGQLIRSRTTEEDSDGIMAGFSADYAAIHEFGGVAGNGAHIPARPYIRPSLSQASNAMADAYVAECRRALGGSA